MITQNSLPISLFKEIEEQNNYGTFTYFLKNFDVSLTNTNGQNCLRLADYFADYGQHKYNWFLDKLIEKLMKSNKMDEAVGVYETYQDLVTIERYQKFQIEQH